LLSYIYHIISENKNLLSAVNSGRGILWLWLDFIPFL